jgi:transposase-like protein
MNSREMAMVYRLQKWSQSLRERVANGESIKEFCENKGVSRNTYFYWQRKLRELACVQLSNADAPQKALSAPVFTEVRIAESPARQSDMEESRQGQLRAEVSGVHITTDDAYPTDKLAALLRELARSC